MSEHKRIMDRVEQAVHALLNHEAPAPTGAQSRTQAEQQALEHGYVQGWEAHREATRRQPRTGKGE